MTEGKNTPPGKEQGGECKSYHSNQKSTADYDFEYKVKLDVKPIKMSPEEFGERAYNRYVVVMSIGDDGEKYYRLFDEPMYNPGIKVFTPSIEQLEKKIPYQMFEAPEFLCDVLEEIERALNAYMEEKCPVGYFKPFRRCGSYRGEAFSVIGRSTPEVKSNFHWEDVKISWYPEFGENMSVNKVLSENCILRLREECLAEFKESDE